MISSFINARKNQGFWTISKWSPHPHASLEKNNLKLCNVGIQCREGFGPLYSYAWRNKQKWVCVGNDTSILKFSSSLCMFSSVNYMAFKKCMPNSNHIPSFWNAVTHHHLPPQQNSSHFHQICCDFLEETLRLGLLSVDIYSDSSNPLVYSSALKRTQPLGLRFSVGC